MRTLSAPVSVGELSLARSLVLATMAVLFLVADWLPDNPYVDPDHVELWLALGFGAASLVLALRDRDATITAAWRNRLILLMIAGTVSLLSAEYVTRVLFRDVTTSSDNGGYFSRRWYQSGEVRNNTFGFRERQFDSAKAPGVYRVAVAGDSFTFGNGIRQQDRYSDLVQSRLPSHFEVLNFGIPGANTPEHRVMVQRLVRDVHPDFILLQWYVNDAEDDDSIGRPVFAPLLPYRPLHNWLNNSSALYTVANMQWAETQVALGMSESYTDYLHRRLGDPHSPDSIRDRDLLRDLIATAQQAHVPIGIVLFPDTAGKLDDRYPFAYLHQRVLDVCTERGITCVDLLKDFAAIKDRQSLWANRLDHHPSGRANAIAAERILEAFSPAWLTGEK
jgi:lysophospholipase L1-like esterase